MSRRKRGLVMHAAKCGRKLIPVVNHVASRRVISLLLRIRPSSRRQRRRQRRIAVRILRQRHHRRPVAAPDVKHPIAMSSAVGGVSVHEIEVGDPVSIVRRLLVNEHRLAEIWVLGISNLSFSNFGL